MDEEMNIFNKDGSCRLLRSFHYSDFNIMLKKGAQNESSDTWLAYINIQDMSLTFTYINLILYIKKYIIILRVSILLDALV